MRVVWSLPPWVWPLLLAAAVILAAWVHGQYRRVDPPLPTAARRWLTGLRCTALALLLLALAGPAVVLARRQALPPEATIVIDDSASMSLADGPAGQTRWARALRLAAVADSVLQRREPPVRVRLMRGNGQGPAREIQRREDTSSLPVAVGTDLAALVGAARTGGGIEARQGIVLLTDGYDTSGRDATAATIPPPGTAALLAVGLGDPVGPPDQLVQDLRYPETAYAGEDALVEVSVGRRGVTAGAGPISVRLSQGDRTVAERSAASPDADGVVTLELTLRPTSPGLQVYDLEISALDNERYLANNRATLAIDVRRERTRLLLLTGRPGWDVRFLAQRAAASERLRLQVVRAGPSGLVLADSGRVWKPPRDATGWRDCDGVVLVGWSGLETVVPWDALAAAVRSGLGLLVLVAEDGPGGGLAAPPAALAGLLPVDLAGAVWREGPWAARAAPEAGAHPILAGVVGDVPPGAGLDSGRLPPLDRLLAVTPRPTAQTLLEAEPLPGAPGKAGAPLLVVGREGDGRVVWFGGRSLWRLAFWESPGPVAIAVAHPGRRFVHNLLAWTASGKGQDGLRLTGGRQVYAEGERIPLETRWDDTPGLSRRGDRSLSVVLRSLDGPDGGDQRSFALSRIVGDSARAAVTLPPLPAGRYEVFPTAGGDPPVAGPARAFVVVSQSVEAAQTRQQQRGLRAFAAAGGGAYLAGETPDAEHRLAATLADWPLTTEARTVRGRWDPLAGWPLLLLATALLGGEWALRRAHGLL